MRKFYSTLFLLLGIFFGFTNCTKEIETTQPPAVLSPSEANSLLARNIQSTEDDVIYLDMTSEQAQKMGITEELYRDALAQIDTLNKSIRKSKGNGVTIVNGFKKKNLTTKNGFPGSGGGGGVDPDNPGGDNRPYPDMIYITSDYLNPNSETYINLENTRMYAYASCIVRSYNFPNYYDISLYCVNNRCHYQLVGSGYSPASTKRFYCGLRPDEEPKDWQFIATVNKVEPKYVSLNLEFQLENIGPQ